MTPEMKLAEMLGSVGAEKVATKRMEELSTDELADLLRSEWSKEKEASMEKEALLDQVIGGVVGHAKGKEQKARGEKHTFGGKQVASLFIPGGVGYQIGRKMGHEKKGKSKKAAAEEPKAKTKEVDPGWWAAQKGMARAKHEDLGLGLAEKQLKKGGTHALGGGAGAIAGGLLGRKVGLTPGSAAAYGGIMGGALGLDIGMMKADDEYLRERGINPKALGFLGAKFTPAAAKKYLREKTKKKEASLLGAGGLVQKGVGRAMQAAVTSPAGTRAAVGAAGGAVAGGLAPTKDGNSRLRNMAVGAAGGAALGAGAKRIATHVGSMNNTAGRYAGGALSTTAKQTGNISAHQQGRAMMAERLGKQRAAKITELKGQATSWKPGTGPVRQAGPAAKKAPPPRTSGPDSW